MQDYLRTTLPNDLLDNCPLGKLTLLCGHHSGLALKKKCLELTAALNDGSLEVQSLPSFWKERVQGTEVTPLRDVFLYRLSEMPTHVLEGQSAEDDVSDLQLQFARLIASTDNQMMKEAAESSTSTWYQ